jgi:hypothetical protein
MRSRPSRAAIVAALALLTLTACGSSKDEPSATLTEYKVSCAQFEDTAKRITDAQSEIYSGSGDTEALDDLVAELDDLKADAPDDVDAAITEMEAGFRKAQQVMEDPRPEGTAELADLAPKLAADGQKITDYVVSQCD